MSQHISDDQLSNFVTGDMGPELASLVATHLDRCSDCRHRALLMDPLQAAFAASTEPAIPNDLASNILENWEEGKKAPLVEIVLGTGLLIAAAVLAYFTFETRGILVESAMWAKSIQHASLHLSEQYFNYTVISIGLAACLTLTSTVAIQPILAHRRSKA